MSKIKVMSDELANKIAAGEVVERPASVVKELLENALDAKASEIKIELVESGMLEITITDNGIGMDFDDALLAFTRHATSKVINEYDLLKIITLGFRGEALPSIASVSDVELKTSNGCEGAFVHVKGSKLLTHERSDLKVGTKISVKNLFYNTPARLKHLKNVYTELANITDYVNKIALSRPDVKFTLVNNGKVLLRTDGQNNLLKTISNVYSIDVAKEMLSLNGSTSDYKISGYTSKPVLQRSSRNYTSLIVNGRIVKSNRISKAILEGYYTYIPHGKHPITVLCIEVDPTLIDVNVHPNKLEIKFSKEDELFALIKTSVQKALKAEMFIPKPVIHDRREVEVMQPKLDLRLEQERVDYSQVVEPIKVSEPIQLIEETIEIEEVMEIIPEPKIEKESLKIYPVGQVLGTYIVGQNEEGMYLIDQHAAAERIRYELYRNQAMESNDVKELLVPLMFEFSLSEALIIEKNIELLRSFDLEVEKFGEKSFRVRSHPIWFVEGEESEDIEKIFSMVLNDRNIDLSRLREGAIIQMSCKLSLKANHSLSNMEIERLIEDLLKCDNPNTCPHGRPVIIQISSYDLEKMFKRVK
jgi:DNA mismatch repair protein MutL